MAGRINDRKRLRNVSCCVPQDLLDGSAEPHYLGLAHSLEEVDIELVPQLKGNLEDGLVGSEVTQIVIKCLLRRCRTDENHRQSQQGHSEAQSFHDSPLSRADRTAPQPRYYKAKHIEFLLESFEFIPLWELEGPAFSCRVKLVCFKKCSMIYRRQTCNDRLF